MQWYARTKCGKIGVTVTMNYYLSIIIFLAFYWSFKSDRLINTEGRVALVQCSALSLKVVSSILAHSSFLVRGMARFL